MNSTTGATAVADALRATTSRHRRPSSRAMAQAASVAVPPPNPTPPAFSNRQLRAVSRAHPPHPTAAVASRCRVGRHR